MNMFMRNKEDYKYNRYNKYDKHNKLPWDQVLDEILIAMQENKEET